MILPSRGHGPLPALAARLTRPERLWLWPPLCVLAAHATVQPAWLLLLCLGLWLWRAWLAVSAGPRPGVAQADEGPSRIGLPPPGGGLGAARPRGRSETLDPLPPRVWRVGLALAALSLVLWQFHGLFGQRAGVPLLLLLLFAKLLETQTLAHKRLLLVLTQFAGMSAFLGDQSLPLTAWLLGAAVFGMAALYTVQPGAPAPPLPAALRRGARLLMGGLPLAVLLFVLFPRLDQPLWRLPVQEDAARSGLSDHMSPGDIANLILSTDIAFRARFDGPAPDPNSLYWRGPVLTRFDGRAWRAGGEEEVQDGRVVDIGNDIQTAGRPLRLAVTLEPHNKTWLLAPGLPRPVPDGTHLAPGWMWRADSAVTQRQRFQLTAWPEYRETGPAADIIAARELPEGFNPRARALAESWRRQDARPQALVAAARALYAARFRYTLRPPPLGLHSVDDFLFNSRAGFCEHYASSFVFLMRAAGLPARVVTGYLGGEINPLDGHLVVRQSEAHAWAEVWFGPTRGWVRVDPTASVSPLRVERGLGAALPAGDVPPALARLSLPWLQGLRHTWEMLNNGWTQWVLGYGQEQQLRLLARLSHDLANPRALAGLAIAAGALALALIAALTLRGARLPREDRALAAWRRVEGRLARLGLLPRTGETAHQLRARAVRLHPRLDAPLTRVLALYDAVRYDEAHARLAELEHAARAFNPIHRP